MFTILEGKFDTDECRYNAVQYNNLVKSIAVTGR